MPKAEVPCQWVLLNITRLPHGAFESRMGMDFSRKGKILELLHGRLRRMYLACFGRVSLQPIMRIRFAVLEDRRDENVADICDRLPFPKSGMEGRTCRGATPAIQVLAGHLSGRYSRMSRNETR